VQHERLRQSDESGGALRTPKEDQRVACRNARQSQSLKTKVVRCKRPFHHRDAEDSQRSAERRMPDIYITLLSRTSVNPLRLCGEREGSPRTLSFSLLRLLWQSGAGFGLYALRPENFVSVEGNARTEAGAVTLFSCRTSLAVMLSP